MFSLLSLILIVLSVVGCSSEKTIILDEPSTTVEYVYVKHNQWIYSQMNYSYLWRLDMPDSLACNYELNPPEFFQSLLSEKDRFSYLANNPNYSSEESANLGFAYQKYRDSKGTEAILILYTTSDEIVGKGIHRGDFFSVVKETNEYIDIRRVSLDVNRNLFEDGSEVFRIYRNYFKHSTVIKDSVYHIDNHSIGYMCYAEFDHVSDLNRSLRKFSDNEITDLVLDLRYNPGGYVSTCQFLCNCIVPEKAYGNIFQQYSYNDVLSRLYKLKTGDERTFSYFSTPSDAGNSNLSSSLVPLKMNRIFILVSANTASASEATIICLAPYMEVVVIGDKTVGKGVGSYPIMNNKFKYGINAITFRYYNALGESVPDDGIIPDFLVSDYGCDKLVGLGDINEPLLNAALKLIIPEMNGNMDSKGSRNISFSTLRKIGEPSFVLEFNNKYHQYEN